MVDVNMFVEIMLSTALLIIDNTQPSPFWIIHITLIIWWFDDEVVDIDDEEVVEIFAVVRYE